MIGSTTWTLYAWHDTTESPLRDRWLGAGEVDGVGGGSSGRTKLPKTGAPPVVVWSASPGMQVTVAVNRTDTGSPLSNVGSYSHGLTVSTAATSNPSFPLRRPKDYACDQEEDGRDLPKEFPVHPA